VEAYDSEGQFNVVDLATGWKADLIMRRSRAFSRTEFDRRTVVEFEGMRVPIATAGALRGGPNTGGEGPSLRSG
jgi:hypothetical protein